MMISEVSIHRPVFATVLSMMLLVVGLIGVTRLWQGIRELPDIAAPVVSIETRYRGASRADRREQDHPADRRPHRRHRAHRQAALLERGRAFADLGGVRPRPQHRRSRQRHPRSRRPRGQLAARRGGSAGDLQGGRERRAHHLRQPVERHAGQPGARPTTPSATSWTDSPRSPASPACASPATAVTPCASGSTARRWPRGA